MFLNLIVLVGLEMFEDLMWCVDILWPCNLRQNESRYPTNKLKLCNKPPEIASYLSTLKSYNTNLKPESIQHCLWPPDLHSIQLWVVTYLWPRFWDRQGLGNSSHGTLLSCGHMSGYWDSYMDTDTDSPKTQSGKLWDKIMGMNTWHKIL